MDDPDATLALWDWRRRMHALGAEVRGLMDEGRAPEAWQRWRDTRDALFAEHPQSPLEDEDRSGFAGLTHFPYDPRYAVEAEVHPAEEETLGVTHSASGETAFRRFAVARFEIDDRPLELSLFWLESYGGGVFVPFRDVTSGAETYGGGRYLLDTVKGADHGHRGEVLRLDLNLAYHPSCVYSPRWSCPLAPPENHLPVAIRAGERLPDGHPSPG